MPVSSLGWTGDSGVLPLRDTVECAGKPAGLVPALQWSPARTGGSATAVRGERTSGRSCSA